MVSAQRQAKADVIALRHRQLVYKQSELTPQLLASLRRIVSLPSEKGASSWLSVLPIEEHGFALHKGAFIGMHCVYDMVGYPIVYLLSVSVVMALLLIMQ